MNYRSDDSPGLLQDQYAHYQEARRQHINLIWQIPSVVVGAFLIFLGVTSDRIVVWVTRPYIPCVLFLVLALFTIVMTVFHRRNVRFLRNFEAILAAMESGFGITCKAYARMADKKWRWYNRVPSSTLLEIFLWFIFLLNFVGFIIFLRQWFYLV